MIDRRTLLRGLAALTLAPLGTLPARAAGPARYVAARQEADGRFSAVVFDLDTGDEAVIPLPGRGHDMAVAADGRAIVVFARRPGTFAVAIRDRRPAQVFEAPPDRHFYGHGAFSPDGALLYATENDFAAGRGVVGVYETSQWRRVGELNSYGVGPHDMALMPDGRTLAIANGGIATDPDFEDGRTPLDGEVEASLALIDRETGDRLGRWRLPAGLRDMSVRHLTVDAERRIWFGGQWHGREGGTPPLIGSITASGRLSLVETAGLARNLGNYIGAMAADRTGRLIAAASPRAGMVALVDAGSGRIVGQRALVDGCGIAAGPEPASILATSGRGRIEILTQTGPQTSAEVLRTVAARWDNHVRPVG